MAEKKKTVSGVDIKSSGKAVENEKSKQQKAAMDDLKKKSETAKQKAEAARKAASSDKVDSDGGGLKDTAVAVGGAVLGKVLDAKKKGKKIKWGLILVIAVVVIGGVLIIGPKLSQSFSLSNLLGTDMRPDETMGYNSIDFQNAILGEAREKQELIVMEQDVQVDTEISNALANIEIFKKTQMIHTFGTGVYTVDLSKIDADHIAVDETGQTVTVTIPHAVLQYVNVDVDQTTFEETEHEIFGFGDIKLTQEQQKVVDESIDDVMRETLSDQVLLDQADEIAVLKVAEIFQPLVSAVSDTYLVEVVQE